MADTRENKSELEAMEEFAKQMWERYFKPKASEELLGHSLDGYKATVKTNNGDGTLTVTRPFDCCEQTLRCPPGLVETAQPGDQVLAVNLGDASNSFILCKTDLSGLGGSGGGADVHALGDIAELTVDRLNTTQRIRNYFLQSTANDYYIRIQDGYIQYVTGAVASQTPVQVTNRYGQTLYWERQPVGHTIDGEPTDSEGNRIYSTVNETSWPVYTYTYTDTVQASFAYQASSGAQTPTLTFGAGDANGRTKGEIKKAASGFDISFTDTGGATQGVSMNSAGYMDLYGLRKPTTLDFSGWNTGYFSETRDGNIIENWLVQFDSQGRPVKFTDGAGHETVVSW